MMITVERGGRFVPKFETIESHFGTVNSLHLFGYRVGFFSKEAASVVFKLALSAAKASEKMNELRKSFEKMQEAELETATKVSEEVK